MKALIESIMLKTVLTIFRYKSIELAFSVFFSCSLFFRSILFTDNTPLPLKTFEQHRHHPLSLNLMIFIVYLLLVASSTPFAIL